MSGRCLEDVWMEEKMEQRRKKKKKKKSNMIINIILVVAIICFLGSGGYLFKYYYTSYSAEKKITDLEDKIIKPDGENQVPETVVETNKAGETEVIDAKYLELYRENNDFIGWVSVDGTPLSYPVMYTPEDGEYYLHRNFEKEYEYSGLPFVDARCTVEQPSQNIVIYGHNMKSQTMFSTIMKYKDRAYLEEHPVIRFDTIYGAGEYEICFIILANAYGDGENHFKYYDFIEWASEEEFNEGIEMLKALSVYDTGVAVTMQDKLITLSTCEYSQENGRMALIAKRITD